MYFPQFLTVYDNAIFQIRDFLIFLSLLYKYYTLLCNIYTISSIFFEEC